MCKGDIGDLPMEKSGSGLIGSFAQGINMYFLRAKYLAL